MIDYPPKFKQFLDRCVEKCDSNNLYIGWGNPNSPILFVGQEPSGENDVSLLSRWTSENVLKLLNEPNSGHFPAQHTWRNYQRMYECIKCGSYNPHPEKVDFVRYIFTTEMSGLVSSNNAGARKLPGHADHLQWRKDNFFTDEFFKSFPVVVLACGNYLRNDGYKGKWEINSIFDVTFDKDNGKHYTSPCNCFWTHHSSDGSRLVIHTRNLSSGVNCNMLIEMGRVIHDHLERLGLISFFK